MSTHGPECPRPDRAAVVIANNRGISVEEARPAAMILDTIIHMSEPERPSEPVRSREEEAIRRIAEMMVAVRINGE